MPGTKRKASFALPYERPTKLTKHTTSTTVRRVVSISSSAGPKFEPLKFPSLRATEPATTEIAMSSSDSSGSDVTTTSLPSLRRASTLTLEDNEEKSGEVAGTSGRRLLSKSSKSVSLTTKSSSNTDEAALVTRLSGLPSGSIVGETFMVEPVPSTSRDDSATKLSPRKSLTKVLSKKKPSVCKDVLDCPSIPSGLTKLALPSAGTSINVSKTGLIGDIDGVEVTEALATLKSYLSKEKSKTGESERNNVDNNVDNKDEAMDEEHPGTSVEPAPPPGGYLDIAISFDTTGSMMGCVNEVKAKVQSLVQRLQADIPGINIAIIAHGDYCDADKYVVKWIDLGATLPEICDFVTNVEMTFGGDGPECYELVLKRAREVLSWRPGSQRVLIMIGDEIPHEPGYKYGGKTYQINWRDECKELKNMGVKVYGVQAGTDGGAEWFHKEMARLTSGRHLKLGSFESCFDFLMMICYREGNPDMLETYEEEMRARDGRLNKDTSFCMAALTGAPPKAKKVASIKKTGAPLKKTTVKRATPKSPKFKAKTAVALPATKKAITKAKKVVKATAAKKASAKKKKVAPKADRVLKREKVPDANLTKGPLKPLKWSKWECAITANPKEKSKTIQSKKYKSKSSTDSKYTSCKHLPGHRLKGLFDNDTKTPAIYEVAVQVKESGTSKKHVMYYRRSIGWSKVSWDRYLLRHSTVKAEVNKALAAGYSIWVRRGVPVGKRAVQIKRVNKANEYIRDKFDYAWKKYIWRKNAGQLKHRQVAVSNKGSKAVISHGGL